MDSDKTKHVQVQSLEAIKYNSLLPGIYVYIAVLFIMKVIHAELYEIYMIDVQSTCNLAICVEGS